MSPGSWFVDGTTTKKLWGQIISNKMNSNNNKFGNYASWRLSVVQNTDTMRKCSSREAGSARGGFMGHSGTKHTIRI